MRSRIGGIALALVAALASGCGGGAASDQTIAFHGQREVFPGLMQDTGYQPSGSPVQLRFTASAMGGDTIDARATAGGSRTAPTLTGNRATGSMALDVHIAMHTTIKIDVSALGHHFTYEGPLMMVPDLDFHGAGMAAFDPFLIDGSAPVTADVPEMALPPIDLMLATGIPGTLTLYLSGTVHSAFTGTCAAIDTDGTAQYRGRITTDGTVHVRAEVTLSVPGFSRTLPSITVPVDIPATTQAVDLGTVPVTTYDSHAAADAGGSMAMIGRCAESTADAGTEMDGSIVDSSIDGNNADATMDSTFVDDANDATMATDSAVDVADGDACTGADAGCVTDVDCCAGLRCASGHCAMPPDIDATRYGVYVMSGGIPSSNAGGSDWDPFNGAPDPYVVVAQGTTTGMTTVAGDTFSPTWSQAYQVTATGAELRRMGLIFTVFDDDPTSGDDMVGTCTVNGTSLESAFAGGPRLATCSPSTLSVGYRLDVR